MINRNLFWIKLTGAMAGGIGGLLYWKFIGCTSGTCPIKSVWYWSTLWGAAMGYLLSDLMVSLLMKRKIKNEK